MLRANSHDCTVVVSLGRSCFSQFTLQNDEIYSFIWHQTRVYTQLTITLTDYTVLVGRRWRKWLNNHSPMITISLTHCVKKICPGTHFANLKWNLSIVSSIQKHIWKQQNTIWAYAQQHGVVVSIHCCELQPLGRRKTCMANTKTHVHLAAWINWAARCINRCHVSP